MRAAALLMLTGLALGAAACASVEPPPATTPSIPPAPAPIENHDWFFDNDEDQAGLSYGLDESDDVWLSLHCRQDSARLELSRPVGAGHPMAISVESGGEAATYPARSEPSELHDGVFLIADAGTRDPVFQQFRRTGWMIVLGPDARDPMVPHPETETSIERFFAFCG